MRISFVALAALVACAAPTKQSTTPAPPPVAITSPPLTGVAVPVAPHGLEPPQPTLRLPKNLVATGYDARLSIDPSKPTFDGTIEITGTVSEPSSVIWLHGRHLRVAHAAASHDDPSATSGGNRSPLVVTPRGDDLLELRADPPLDAGTWRIEIEYAGDFDELNTAGAFKETVAGKPYVFSQFEAIYARRVFPCIDEPDSKVPWHLSLTVPQSLVAVSNTPIARETAMASGSKLVEFTPTKPLPSYLVAFAVGPFDIVDGGKTKAGTPVRVVTLAGRAADAAFAAKSTARVVDLLEDWFAIPYPYAKLDLVTVPLTVGFGAMENAGMVTFTERLMLFDQSRPSRERQWRWVNVAAHELAHQWFGDLVTMAWWDDIWLNEGFANWMETKILAKYDPSWHAEQADVEQRVQALDADALPSARAIRQPIERNDDIFNVFDAITYDKGATVLRMFESYVGADVFQRGVRDYLTARAFGNATSADFIAAISAASGKDLAPALATFLERTGEPEVEATTTCGGAGAHVALTQHRYVAPGTTSSAAPSERGDTAAAPWQIPVCIAYGASGTRAEACTLLAQDTATIELKGACPAWVELNASGRGYYRSRYTAAQAAALRDVAWPQLTETERRAVFFDVAAVAHYRPRGRQDVVAMPPGMKLPLPLALSLIPKLLAGGDRFTVADAVSLPLALDRFVADDQRGKLETWIRATFGPGATHLGLTSKPNEDLDVERERVDLFLLAAWLGRDPELVKKAVELGQRWTELPAAIRGPILAIAVDASPELFAHVLAAVKTEPDRSKRDEMVFALGHVRDPARVQQALALALDRTFDIRESIALFTAWSSEPTRAVVEAFYREHEAELSARMPKDEVRAGAGALASVLAGACDQRRRDDVVRDVMSALAGRPGGDRLAHQAIETLDRCIASRAALEPAVRSWLGGVRPPRPARAVGR
jgi:alanyl aminopeptidase